jgi:nucleoside-triphosphatase THEP1
MVERILLFTGAPGSGKTTALRRVAAAWPALPPPSAACSGKTTALRRVAAALPHARLRGFLTEEIHSRGWRSGFRLASFDGRVVTL